MELLVRNAEGNLSTKDREYAAKKFGKLDRYFHTAQKVEIVHREEKLQHRPAHRIEVTVYADGMFIRGEESDTSLTAAIDLVAMKMENRLRRLKTKIVDAHRHRGHKAPPVFEEILDATEEDTNDIVETKKFLMKPMSHEEAMLQMELSGHPFFLFQNDKTNRPELLYKRDRGGYGLLTPDR